MIRRSKPPELEKDHPIHNKKGTKSSTASVEKKNYNVRNMLMADNPPLMGKLVQFNSDQFFVSQAMH
ncbi:hypothetical protein T265_01284 [Opisthorchis viverrini]|uniref:Uncharacterized protein n=1 Tax=Opisthorchis viverrini TaxID=6198 RepID=A0A075AJ15_OPIVI|nr:hypothetical protein T265_01284 [Opisthorchis viverrini]KER32594.1 hypothetical protein T265_01284 [Opisthorchis viverrini]